MPEEMRANLAETALTQARRFYPASVSREPRGQPAFVTAAPLWLATAADAEKKYQAATETRLFRGCARTYNVGDYKDIGRGELVLASMEARINGVLWRPTPVHFTARLALIKTAREEGLPVKLLIPEKEEKDSPVANFIAAALALGGVETFRAIDFTPAFLPWPRNFASQVDGRILPNHNIADVLLESAAGERRPFFPSLGIDPRRVLSPSFLGSGGEALFGEDFALIPDYAAGMEGFFSGKAKNAEAWAIAKALGREGFFLPLPIIDAVSLDYRPRKKFPLAIKQRVEDLDYRILLLRKGKRIFVAQDYYDRFEAAVSAVLNQIKTRYGYQWEVVSAPFREDLNVPELPDGTVLVYQGSSPLISALQKANIPCKTVDYEPVEGNILCGSDGFLRCASNIFING